MKQPYLMRRLFMFSLVAAATALGFQNCGPANHAMMDDELNALNSACRGILVAAFSAGYHPFLKTNCATCHANGPGSGFFASDDGELSFANFLTKGESKIAEFAVSTHKPPSTGAHLTDAVNPLKADWSAAMTEYETCVASAPADGGGVLDIPAVALIQPTKMLVEKSANPALNQNATLTWNTANEFVNVADAFQGGSIALTVRAVNLGGDVTGYQFQNLRFINSSAGAAVIKHVNIYVNGTLVDGETFLYVDRYVPNLTGNNSRRLAPGAAFHASAIGSAIQVKLAVGVLKAAEIDFRPVTYQQLTAAGGIFAQNCASCHGTSGGLALGANNYNNVVGRTANSDMVLVNPFTLLDNFIYARMNDPNSPMPPTGVLPQEQRDRVRDWILDGAPLNDAAVAR